MNKVLTAEQILVEALKEIISPISYMQSRLEDGERLDGGYAIALSENVPYLQTIAKKALEAYKNQSSVSDEEDLEPSKEQDSEPVASHTGTVGNSIEQKAVSLLRQIYDGYTRFNKYKEIPDSTCKTCHGFLYVERGGVGEVDCPSCNGTGSDFESGFDTEGFTEFIEHSIMFADTPFLELIGETEHEPNGVQNDERIATQQTMPEEPKAGIQNYPH